jgi:Protein of unknown function (DUF4435)
MSVDNLRASRGKSVAVFVEFTRLYKQYESALYCFFEGEDSRYYGIRIKNITRPKKDIYLNCKGKQGVLGIHRMLASRNHYRNTRAAYFIDRDFDQSIFSMGLSGIYETPCYSIENFYTSVQCFSEILKNEFKLTESDENFERCVSLYKKRQEEFHDAVDLLNAWIACNRDRSSQFNISYLSVLRFIHDDLNQVIATYTIDDLSNLFPDTPVISQQELDTKKYDLKVDTRQKSFRGKFEIEFLFAFLQKLMNEANQGNYPYFTCKVKVVLSLTKRTIISDLSQYADTPDCLHRYLESLRLAS